MHPFVKLCVYIHVILGGFCKNKCIFLLVYMKLYFHEESDINVGTVQSFNVVQ